MTAAKLARSSVELPNMTPLDFAEYQLYRHRTVYLSGIVDDGSAQETITLLESLFLSGSDPIWVLLNSPGGSVTAGLAVYDTIRRLVERESIEVHIEARGYAASMGAIILQAASEGCRYATKNAQLLLHEPLSGGMFVERATETAERAKEMAKLRDRLVDMMIGRSKLTKRQLTTKLSREKRDWWLDAPTALQYGLIDAIN